MKLSFENKRISGLLTVFPANESRFDDELENYNFSAKNSRKLKRVVGFDRHRVVEDDSVCASDLCAFGMEHLFAESLLERDSIDGLVLVTETPDYFMPPTSNVLQARLGLKPDMFCLDISQGCAGFLVGLLQGFMMLDQPAIEKVVLLTADTLSRTINKKDRNAYPLIGDAAAIAVLERDERGGTIHANLKMDGARHEAIMIPAGAFRHPSSSETAREIDAGDGNIRSQENYNMNGVSVFNFVQNDIPPLVEENLAEAGAELEDVDYFMFHQPNRFILEKLADRMGVPREKMPNDIVENYGNPSSASVPATICHKLGSRLTSESFSMCLAGFGVGLTYSTMLLPVGDLDFCEILDF